ncbi:hypothetical protein, partial [Sphingomonas sp.]|uniref:hypothetical protein n=1 Tax=Sphingomonas sp. TaxID=28214 RepID=UPI003B3A17E9
MDISAVVGVGIALVVPALGVAEASGIGAVAGAAASAGAAGAVASAGAACGLMLLSVVAGAEVSGVVVCAMAAVP